MYLSRLNLDVSKFLNFVLLKFDDSIKLVFDIFYVDFVTSDLHFIPTMKIIVFKVDVLISQ